MNEAPSQAIPKGYNPPFGGMMNHVKTMTLMFLLPIISCTQPGPQPDVPRDQADRAPVHEAAPDDDLHGTLDSMPTDDTHAQAMADMRGSRQSGVNTEIRLPEHIQAAWSGVRIRVVDSTTGVSERYDVSLGEATALGNTGLTLVADSFIPDFVMDEAGITSRSAGAENPATHVVISEQGVEPYEGWLFAAMPDIHPYPHDRYRVLLEEGIPAG